MSTGKYIIVRLKKVLFHIFVCLVKTEHLKCKVQLLRKKKMLIQILLPLSYLSGKIEGDPARMVQANMIQEKTIRFASTTNPLENNIQCTNTLLIRWIVRRFFERNTSSD